MNFRSDLLENQLKGIEREQKLLADKIIRNSVRQVGKTGGILEASSLGQRAIGNVTADQGINDVNIALTKISSSDDGCEACVCLYLMLIFDWISNMLHLIQLLSFQIHFAIFSIVQ